MAAGRLFCSVKIVSKQLFCSAASEQKESEEIRLGGLRFYVVVLLAPSFLFSSFFNPSFLPAPALLPVPAP